MKLGNANERGGDPLQAPPYSGDKKDLASPSFKGINERYFLKGSECSQLRRVLRGISLCILKKDPYIFTTNSDELSLLQNLPSEYQHGYSDAVDMIVAEYRTLTPDENGAEEDSARSSLQSESSDWKLSSVECTI
mmetsp:Transcript_28680/g.37057  ORF Transcript_28680/g.37057 Transcript_28680/m.37057 type:complete len:135 (+) Transcript_28680:1037-1441(+)